MRRLTSRGNPAEHRSVKRGHRKEPGRRTLAHGSEAWTRQDAGQGVVAKAEEAEDQHNQPPATRSPTPSADHVRWKEVQQWRPAERWRKLAKEWDQHSGMLPLRSPSFS